MKLKNFIAYFLLLCLSVTLLASCSDDSDGKVDFFVLKDRQASARSTFLKVMMITGLKS